MNVHGPFHQPRERFRREWWWLAALWLAAGVLLAAVLGVERHNTEVRERQRLAQQARTIHDNLGRQLDAINRALASLIEVLPRWRGQADGMERVGQRLRAFSDAMTGVRTMALMDAEGTVLAASRDELVGGHFGQRPYFLAARQAAPGTLVVSPPFRTALGVWAIILARVVPGPDGGFGGIVTATLDPEEFQTLLESVRYAPDMLSALAHGDGLRFLMVAEQPGPPGVNLAQPGTLFTRHRESGRESSVFLGEIEAGGAPRLMAMHTIQPPELRMDKPLVAAAGRDWHMVFADWRAKAWILGGAYLLVGLAAAGGLHFMQRRRREIWGQERALAERSAALEARWRAVLEATNQGVWDWDVRTDKVYYSPVWKTMLGYAEEEIGDSLDEWESRLHPDDRERAHAALQSHMDGETPFYENVHRMRRKDGGYRWFLDRGRTIERDADGRPLRLVGTHGDVTEQRQHRERLDRLTENVPGMLYQYQREADGRSHFPYASAGIQDIYGFQPEELRQDASPVFGRIHPDDLQRVGEGVEQSARTLDIWRAEYRVVLPGRGERWVSGQARPQVVDSGTALWHGYIHDVTEAKQQSIQLQETERLLKHLMNEMPIGLCMVDATGRMYYRNRRFLELFGYTEAEVPTLEQWWLRAYPDASYREQVIRIWNGAVARSAESGGDIQDAEYHITTLDGTQRTVGIGGLTFGSHFLATFIDRTEQKAQSELLHKLAYMDGLTGVANRRHFDQTLQSEWRRCRRSRQPLALVMIDIDHFKLFNDCYGHQKGDECLQAVAALLRAGFSRSHDLVARYGGEEFICLMPECDLASARTKAQALCRAVQALGIAHGSSRTASVVTISLGVACLVPDGDSSPQGLLARADANLYRAKTGGRNRVDDGGDLLS